MNDSLTLIVICVIILLGFYLKQFWISLIFVIILVLGLIATRKKAPVPVPTGGGPEIRPIIVKRKYVGPESIYPKKMLIKYSPYSPSDWRDYGPEAVGTSVGKGFKWFWDSIFGKEEEGEEKEEKEEK